MKRFYFVRHGESVGNAGKVYQPLDSGLSELGIKQAQVMAERCSKLPIRHIVSSTLARAQETAEIISKKVGRSFESSDLLVEYRRPSQQRGLVRDSDESKNIDKIVADNFYTSGYHYSDEENFQYLDKRAGEALKFLSSQKTNEILVITHGLFLRIMIGKAVFGDSFDPKMCQNVLNHMMTNNTGLSILELDGDQWILRTFNDHAHLG